MDRWGSEPKWGLGFRMESYEMGCISLQSPKSSCPSSLRKFV